jgi:hypothetical protein
MNNKATAIELLFDKAGDYSKTTAELLQLNAIDKSAEVISSFAVKLAISIVAAMFIFFTSIGIALLIGENIDNYYAGFFIVAGCYLLIAALLYTFRQQWIKTPVSNSIITQMLQQKPE